MAVAPALANSMLAGMPGTLYVQVHSGDPGASGTDNVIVGASRGTVTIPAASGGARTVSAAVDCPGIPAGASVSHVSYWDAPAGGTFQFPEPLAASVSFIYAGRLRFTSQVFTIQTTTGGSQTATSINADSTAAADSNVTRLVVNVTDTTGQSDSNACALGALSSVTDSSSASDSNTIALGVVVSDSASSSDSNTAEVPDVTAPTVDTFTVGTPTGSSVPVTAFTASDAVGVTGYLITESSTPPAAGAAGWTGSAPATYTAVGTGSVTLYPWAKDAAGNVSSVFGSPRTVTISGGAVSVSDDFNRANEIPIAGNWSAIPTCTGLSLNSNAVVGSAGYGSYWLAGSAPADNQYAEAQVNICGTGVTARTSTSQKTFYSATTFAEDDGEGGTAYGMRLLRCVNGTITVIAGPWYAAGDLAGSIVRIEANGTSIKAYELATHGGTKTERLSATDANIASGRVGIYSPGSGKLDNFYGGDL